MPHIPYSHDVKLSYYHTVYPCVFAVNRTFNTIICSTIVALPPKTIDNYQNQKQPKNPKNQSYQRFNPKNRPISLSDKTAKKEIAGFEPAHRETRLDGFRVRCSTRLCHISMSKNHKWFLINLITLMPYDA